MAIPGFTATSMRGLLWEATVSALTPRRRSSRKDEPFDPDALAAAAAQYPYDQSTPPWLTQPQDGGQPPWMAGPPHPIHPPWSPAGQPPPWAGQLPPPPPWAAADTPWAPRSDGAYGYADPMMEPPSPRDPSVPMSPRRQELEDTREELLAKRRALDDQMADLDSKLRSVSAAATEPTWAGRREGVDEGVTPSGAVRWPRPRA